MSINTYDTWYYDFWDFNDNSLYNSSTIHKWWVSKAWINKSDTIRIQKWENKWELIKETVEIISSYNYNENN